MIRSYRENEIIFDVRSFRKHLVEQFSIYPLFISNNLFINNPKKKLHLDKQIYPVEK